MTVFDRAIVFATSAHSGQIRKADGRPYILHPMAVASIVGAYTTDNEVLAAAVLHDTVEDAGVTKDELAEKFGSRVADLVCALSENKRRDMDAADSWMKRKAETVAEMATASYDVKLICLADKLANLRDMKRNYDLIGDKLWDCFNQKDKWLHEWYYDSVLGAIADDFDGTPAVAEYKNIMDSIFG